MKFKNDLERLCFEAAVRALGTNVNIEHNKKITIESALYPEVASFSGPPKKEIDVLVATLSDNPKVVLLISCKSFAGRAEPAHVQEWVAVVQTMNKYSAGTTYFGLILCPPGFTSGSEPWATTHNLGLLPPMKGTPIAYSQETVIRMLERVLKALKSRISIHLDDLPEAPHFFEFVFRLSADFDGYQEAAKPSRYYILPKHWGASFGEMYSIVKGKTIEKLFVLEGASVIQLSSNIYLRVEENRILVGPDSSQSNGIPRTGCCYKNGSRQPTSKDYIFDLTRGTTIVSAADFGEYIEFGLDYRFNLAIRTGGFALISTEYPHNQNPL